MSIKISVIVPVYNSEHTLRRCVDSILSQTFSDYEIILVDDGSTDGSAAICDSYCEKYDFVKVIHKVNEGLGPARNAGISASAGEYIYHCDSDDWIEKVTLEKCYHAVSEQDADLLVFGYQVLANKNGELTKFDDVVLSNDFIQTKSACQDFFLSHFFDSFVMQVSWNKLYKRSFLDGNKVFFRPYRRCQDQIYALDIFSKANSMVVLENQFYNYIIQPGIQKCSNYIEKMEAYLDIYRMTQQSVASWGKSTNSFEEKLLENTCETIANETSFFIVKKYRKNWRKCLNQLFSNKEIMDLFEGYKNLKHSKYMSYFTRFLKRRNKLMLFILSYLLMKKNHIK